MKLWWKNIKGVISMEDIKQLKRFQHFVWNIEKMLINLQVMMRKEKRNISVIPGQVSSGM